MNQPVSRLRPGAAAPLMPGSTIGVVGGGQLGRMLVQVAQRHGYRTVVLTGGSSDTPAGSIAHEEIAGGFDDAEAVRRFVDASDVITWEFENVDVGLAEVAAEARVPVRPSAAVVAAAQDRLAERAALTDAGVPVAAWREAASAADLAAALRDLGGSVVVKTARMGYDGRGQRRLTDVDRCEEVWRDLGVDRVLVEEFVVFDRELSVIVARGVDGSTVDHGVMVNDHVDHILDTTMVPADVADSTTEAARSIARRVAEHLEVEGVLCVELFDIDGRLLVNEIAPRPHNSGHCTIEAAPASQFEQQLRAICGLPLGDGRCRPAAMAQLLGDLWLEGATDWAGVLAEPGVHLHLYDKSAPRKGRKMGHLTGVADTPTLALQRVLSARSRLVAST